MRRIFIKKYLHFCPFQIVNNNQKLKNEKEQTNILINETTYLSGFIFHILSHFSYPCWKSARATKRYRCIMTIYAYAVSRKTYLPSAYALWIICWIFVERGGTPRIFRARMEFFRKVQKVEAGLKKSHSRLKIHRGRRGCWTSEKVPSTETAKNIYRRRIYMCAVVVDFSVVEFWRNFYRNV